jgi:hypothetical protein
VNEAARARNTARVPEAFSMAAMVNGICGDLSLAVKMNSVLQGEILVLKRISSLGLRRKQDRLYQPVTAKNSNGDLVFLSAFKPFFCAGGDESDTIEDIINSFPNSSYLSPNWKGYVSSNSCEIARRIGAMNNTHMPRLVTNPCFISFKNGRYDLVSVCVCVFVCFFCWL